jgi:lipoprotein-anchoring transpeptidase ErfK/SrfK
MPVDLTAPTRARSPRPRIRLIATLTAAALAPAACAGSRHEVAPPPPAVQPAAQQAPVQTGPLRLEARLSERKLYVLDGTQATAYDVSVGKNERPTPRGSFRIKKIVWNPAWVPPDERWARGKAPQPPGAAKNPMKVVKIFFREPDYYIHGTDDLESLGAAASHGCLRMHPDDAYRVARYLMEHGGQPRDEGWFARVLHFRRETKTVYLDAPVALTVTD